MLKALHWFSVFAFLFGCNISARAQSNPPAPIPQTERPQANQQDQSSSDWGLIVPTWVLAGMALI
jgi:hypothetical protein